VSNKRVFFYVQHLLGIGHQRRGATLARAIQTAGMDVTYVSGGTKIPNLNLGGGKLVQLPPTRATDLFFKVLVDEHDQPIDDDWRERRKDALLAAWRECDPHVLILELYPFGRRQMRFELLPLLDAAIASPKRPVIVSSVRDILVASAKPERIDEMRDRVESYFDHVMVHGDPNLIPFERTFPLAKDIEDKIIYTGYVVDTTGQKGGPGTPGHDEILVSAGGGAVGEKLLRTALKARPLTGFRDLTWRVLTGVNAGSEEIAALEKLAEPGVIIERARGDFPSLLMNCALSISQGGYNTIMEGLHAQCRALIVPYAGGLETEQTLRANLLKERGLIETIEEADLSPDNLAIAIEVAMAKRRPKEFVLNTDGAAAAGQMVKTWSESTAW
jgi:predicted glycosyltransferase